jgi:tetratricopeptide (TPR) repeat protein
MNRNSAIDEKWQLCCAALALVVGLCLANVVWAESGILVVNVQDVHKHPVVGVEIGVEGDGGSAVTDDHGKARISLAAQNKQRDWVSLQILKSPSGKNLVMVSPWDSRTPVPSFENESENFVRVVVVELRDRAALEDASVLTALAAKINKANAPKTVEKEGREEDPKANLAAVAKQYGLDPEELDKAIRSWGEKTTDPYEAGLAALYQRNYPVASQQLRESLKNGEGKLAADQKAVADTAFFLGESLYEEGKYQEAAMAYQRCLQLRPDDAIVLNNLGDSLMAAGDYTGAEPPLRRALAIDEKALGRDHPNMAIDLNSIAILLEHQRDYAGAELLLRRALAIDEKTLGPDHPQVAGGLNNLGLLLEHEGDYTGAELLFRRALAINEKALGPNHPHVAVALSYLASLLKYKGDYTGAEPLFRRALAIDEKALGPDHPDVAVVLSDLASLLKSKGDYTGAESLFRRALAIDEKALGPDDPEVSAALTRLASLLRAKGDYTGAEPLFRRALAIDEKALGPDHPRTKIVRANLQALVDKQAGKQKEK